MVSFSQLQPPGVGHVFLPLESSKMKDHQFGWICISSEHEAEYILLLFHVACLEIQSNLALSLDSRAPHQLSRNRSIASYRQLRPGTSLENLIHGLNRGSVGSVSIASSSTVGPGASPARRLSIPSTTLSWTSSIGVDVLGFQCTTATCYALVNWLMKDPSTRQCKRSAGNLIHGQAPPLEGRETFHSPQQGWGNVDVA
ncbi:hypothetical protein ElyMa_001029700 [Elysia marginata]|uniref:Uncharacterized protein n=1 Tax=Elysia marginata TaxID=1093978 RepID=A0AAV4HMB7_9GAST|nr:hypothetical protein ElyMa_001029700 [Elysia marginata]